MGVRCALRDRSPTSLPLLPRRVREKRKHL